MSEIAGIVEGDVVDLGGESATGLVELNNILCPSFAESIEEIADVYEVRLEFRLPVWIGESDCIGISHPC